MKDIIFFVVGAQKSGTTFLHGLLSSDDRVFLPEIKETHFFCDGHGEYDNGLPFYIDKYFSRSRPGVILGEVDPEYLYFPDVPKRIYEAFPRARLIFLLRDPAERAFSHYAMSYRRGIETLTFEDAMKLEKERITAGSITEQSDFSYVSRGLYGEQIRRYLEFFPKEKMLFLRADDLYENTQHVLNNVYRFIGLEPWAIPSSLKVSKNEGGVPVFMGVQRFLAKESFYKTLGKSIIPPSFRLGLRRFLEVYNRRPGELPKVSEQVMADLRLCFKNDLVELEEITGVNVADWL